MTTPTRLLNRNFVLLWQGQLVSQLGSQAFTVAMMFWIKHATDSATLMGTLMMASTIPSVLLGPFAGTFADSHSRKWIIVWSDILCGLASISLAAVLFFFPDRIDLGVAWLFIASVFMTTVGAFFRPAISASIPDLVPPDRLAGANSMSRFSDQISGFIGQGLGGVAFRLLGAPVLFLIDGLTYLFSAASETLITIPQVIPEKAKGYRAILDRFKTGTTEGFHYVWRNIGLRNLFLVAAFLNFLLVPIIVLLPFFVEDFLHATPDWFGYMMAALGIGSMVGYLFAGTLRLRGPVRSALVIAAIVTMSILFGLLGLVTSRVVALVVFTLMGIVNGFVNISIGTIMQATTPSEIRGRVFGLLGTLAGGLTPIAMGLSGVVADLLNQNIPLIILLCGGASTLLSLAVAFNAPFRAFLAYESPAVPTAAPAAPPATDIPEVPPVTQ